MFMILGKDENSDREPVETEPDSTVQFGTETIYSCGFLELGSSRNWNR